MHRILDHVETRLRRVLSGALSSLFGGALVLVGLGFLCVAFWVFLASIWGPALAALAIGGALIVLGAIVFAATARHRPPAPAPTPASEVTVAGLVEAFIIGLNAGKQTRSRRPDGAPD